MKERGILMSGPMMCATLDDSKTKTRRTRGLDTINVAPDKWLHDGMIRAVSESEHRKLVGTHVFVCRDGDDETRYIRCPYGVVGDRLWVRETWNAQLEWPHAPGDLRLRWWQDVPRGFRGPKNCIRIHYAADDAEWEVMGDDDGDVWMAPTGEPALENKWRPSIHMPRWASRITLEITDVRVERVQEINEDDCRAEGCAGGHDSIPGYDFSATPHEHYRHLWNSLNAKRGYGWDVNPHVWVIAFRRLDEARAVA